MKTSPDVPPTPAGLSDEAAAFWRKIVKTWLLEDSSLLVLKTACECLDQLRAAEKRIAAEGMTITDRFKQIRPHPCVAIARDARLVMLRCLKQLGLDLEPLHDAPGRPRS